MKWNKKILGLNSENQKQRNKFLGNSSRGFGGIFEPKGRKRKVIIFQHIKELQKICQHII